MPSRKPEGERIVEKSAWESNHTTPRSDEVPATTPTELRQLPAKTTGNEPRSSASCTAGNSAHDGERALDLVPVVPFVALHCHDAFDLDGVPGRAQRLNGARLEDPDRARGHLDVRAPEGEWGLDEGYLHR